MTANKLNRRDAMKQASAAGLSATALMAMNSEVTASSVSENLPLWRLQANESNVLRLVDASEPHNLDPPIATGPYSHIMLTMYETLTKLDPQGEVHPQLALDWTVSEDGLSWSLNLKPDVKFHDGTDFTSASVKYVFKRLRDPDFAAARAAAFNVIEEVDDSDPMVAVLKTARPFPDLPFLLTDQSSAVVSETASEELGYDDFGFNPVGTGPFEFVEWAQNDFIRVKRFDGYHGEPAKLEGLVFRIVPEASAREAILLAGEADVVVSPPPESITRLSENTNFNVITYDSLSQVTSEMRQTQAPFNVKEVRQAMNYAIDNQAIIDSVMSGLGRPIESPAPPNSWGSVQMDPYPYDPEKAQELLAASGFQDGIEGDLFFVSGRWAGDDQVTQALQAYWSMVGINIEIHRIDDGSFSEYLSDDPDNRAGWTTMQIRSSTYLDYHIHRLFHSSSTLADGNQRTGYQNEEVDRLIDEGRGTFDEETRLAAYAEAQRLIWEDAPFVWIFLLNNTVITRAGVEGLEIHPNADLFFGNVVLPES